MESLGGVSAHRPAHAAVRNNSVPLRLRDFCGSQSCIVMHGAAILSVDAS